MTITLDFFRKDHRIPLSIATLFGILLMFNIAQTINLFINADKSDVPTLSDQLHPPTHTSFNLAPLHLFGQYNQNLSNLPKTQLQLRLHGIAFSVTSSKASRVLISGSSQPIKVYKIGDVVPGGATIQNILQDRIILNRNSHLTSLDLPIPKTNKIITSAKQ